MKTTAIGLLFISVMLPLCFRFGVEKGRVIMSFSLFIVVVAASAMVKFGGEFLNSHWTILMVFAAVIIMVSASVFISTKIYQNKEFN